MTGQKWEKFQARVPGDSFQNGMELERAGNSLPQKTPKECLTLRREDSPETRNMKKSGPWLSGGKHGNLNEWEIQSQRSGSEIRSANFGVSSCGLWGALMSRLLVGAGSNWRRGFLWQDTTASPLQPTATQDCRSSGFLGLACFRNISFRTSYEVNQFWNISTLLL